MKTTITKSLLLVIIVLLSECSRGKQNFLHNDGNTIQFKYAKNITLIDYGDYKRVVLRNPWSGEEGWKEYRIEKPYKQLLVSTSVHCAVFEELGCEALVTGVCESNYIKLPYIIKGVADGKIKDCGTAAQPDIEKVVNLSPDVIFLSPYPGAEHDEGSVIARYAEKSNIPIIELADYMEKSPLARAEWIVFYGLLVGKEQEARAVFADVEKKYKAYKQVAAQQKSRPTVIFDKMVQATWFVPGGQSTIGQMAQDANYNYIFADTESSGSIECSFEQVLNKGINADVWILRYSDFDTDGKSDYSLERLEKENSKYAAFQAFKTGNVFGCDVSRTQFFEETPFHPERLLKDFVLIAHPGAIDDRLVYFRKLEGVREVRGS